ncbi:hypothetical protein OPT61_g2257 [Boeremia exigua]|uniref:Uncharacterized protein n=1 Tax=Boeremia exigua TaxID=749465 RepID=A0ACC2IM46_9PLEO|nr:hypothetical protein OPT61_g2257 [Boeremia exigua]
MSRSIELGRAVLSTASANLELWLRTLITISPQQQCTDLAQHTGYTLLQYLSSGKLWVSLRNELYIGLEISFKGQPIADGQLRQLRDSILNAPVWEQLNLQPSLPHDTTLPSGTLRIMISYPHENATFATRQRHRILSSASAADVRPPEEVPSLNLESIVLSVDIFELTQRRKSTMVKRLKVSADSESLMSNWMVKDFEQDELLLEPNCEAPSLASSSTLKRLRRPACSPATPSKANQEFCQISSISDKQTGTSKPMSSPDTGDLEILVDGALRLSVLSRINSKMLPGMKIKASTFELGLADVAPTLWRPGFSLVRQRALKLNVDKTHYSYSRDRYEIDFEILPKEDDCIGKHPAVDSQSRPDARARAYARHGYKFFGATRHLSALVALDGKFSLQSNARAAVIRIDRFDMSTGSGFIAAVHTRGEIYNEDQAFINHPTTSATCSEPTLKHHLADKNAPPGQILDLPGDELLSALRTPSRQAP